MSDVASALPGAKVSGIIEVAEAGPVGMVTIRGDMSDGALTGALKDALGRDVPAPRRADVSDGRGVLWMSPDEVLAICPRGEAAALASRVSEALAGRHHLAVDVSDARAVFHLSGGDGAVREVLAKLTPADLRPATLGVGEVRRTRLAQVSAAFWFEGEGQARVVCFRSVAAYVFGLLANAAERGSRVGHF